MASEHSELVSVIDSLVVEISSSLDLETTLQSITRAATTLADAKTGSIYLLDPDGLYRARSSHGAPLELLRETVLSRDDGMVAEMRRSRGAVQVTNFSDEVATTEQARATVRSLGVRGTLAVPMWDAGECVGALYVAKVDAAPFPPETERLLQRLASFAQVALQNAQRFSNVEAERSRLQDYFDAIPDGVLVFDRTGAIALVNKTLQRDFGTDPRVAGSILSLETIGARPVILRYDQEAVFNRVLASGDSEQGLLEIGDPSQTFEVHFSPLHDRTGQIDGVVATMRDITVPLQLERERSRSNLLAQLLELSIQLNSDLSVPALSDRVVEAAMALVGAGAGTLGLVEEDRLVFRSRHHATGKTDVESALAAGEAVPGRVWQSRRPYVSNASSSESAGDAWVNHGFSYRRLTCVPVVNRSGLVIGTLTLFDPMVERDFGPRDVEALQLLAHQAAIAIENARVNEVKDAFLSIVSHELKTPVTSIKGFAQVLKRRLSPNSDDVSERYLNIINQQTDRLTALINDLLDLSRIQTGMFQFAVMPLEYGALVREVIAEMQLIVPHNRIFVEAPAKVFVEGSADRLRQVLVNLINNAVQHGPAKGDIRVTVEVAGDEVMTYVCDAGPGLPPNEAARIFNPYYKLGHDPSRPSKGLGLGLYIGRQIVNAHGGEIRVDNEGHTSFCFSIALSSEAPAGDG